MTDLFLYAALLGTGWVFSDTYHRYVAPRVHPSLPRARTVRAPQLPEVPESTLLEEWLDLDHRYTQAMSHWHIHRFSSGEHAIWKKAKRLKKQAEKLYEKLLDEGIDPLGIES